MDESRGRVLVCRNETSGLIRQLEFLRSGQALYIIRFSAIQWVQALRHGQLNGSPLVNFICASGRKYTPVSRNLSSDYFCEGHPRRKT